MKMVAGARLARAQQRIVALRPYALKTTEILRVVAAPGALPTGVNDSEADAFEADAEGVHPLLAVRPVKKVLILLLSSDRGLCGAFNTNVLKAAEREWQARKAAGVAVEFATCGKKGREYVNRRGGVLAHDFAGIYDGLSLSKASLVASWVTARMTARDYDALVIVYTEFKSAMTQRVVAEQLLPLTDGAKAPAGGASSDTAKLEQAMEVLFEPNREALLERLVPMYVETSIYRALLESQASEFGARMTSMDAATRNAKEMIGRLTLAYNRARQAAITKELMEIIGGAEALKD